MDYAISYIKGLIFIVISLFVLYSFGKKLLKNTGSFSKCLLVGYISYSALQAIIGITVQLFRLDYFFYWILMVIMVISICVFTFKKEIRKFRLAEYWCKFKIHIKNYKVIYVLATILIILNLCNIKYLWFGNHQDDGYYLLKVALSPFLGSNYDVNYATGFSDALALSRAINTFELDYAFWSNTLGIEPSIFCKAIISCFNYVLILNSFNLILSIFKKDEKDHASIWLSVILFFAIYPETMLNHGILNQQDAWHFNTAIWYGSGIVRSMGLIALIFPYIEKPAITIKKFIWFLITAFALLSKASQALPLIYLAGISILLLHCISNIKNSKKWLIAPSLVLIVLVFIPGSAELENYMLMKASEFLKTPILMASLLIFLTIPFVLKRKEVYIFQIVCGIIMVIMVLPQLNGLFLQLSMVDFVCGRTISVLSFNLIIIVPMFAAMAFNKYVKNEKFMNCLFGTFGALCMSVNLVSLTVNIGLLKPFQILASNPLLIPETSNQLSIELEKIAVESDKQLVAFGNGWLTADNFPHPLDTILRIKAPHIYSLSAVTRFSSMSKDIVYKDFKVDDIYVYDQYREDPLDEKNIELMRKLVLSYPFDVFYDISSEVNEAFTNQFGFHRVKVVEGNISYYISVSEEIYQKLNQ